MDQVGEPIPKDTPHAVSVSLPTWKSNIGYEEGDPDVVSRMQSGYPRFVFHPLVKQLVVFMIHRFCSDQETLLIFDSRRSCHQCRQFIGTGRIAEMMIPQNSLFDHTPGDIVYCLIFPHDKASLVKAYWQHSGHGISSRFANHCLLLLDQIRPFERSFERRSSGRSRYKPEKKETMELINSLQRTLVEKEAAQFVEERFGRNLDPKLADDASSICKSRVALAFGVDLDDVYLFPCGMAAIFDAHQCVLTLHSGKSVQFGFPYLDTLKIQQKFGPGCHFFGHGDAKDLTQLESLLKTEKISSLFCEFPSNPLLRSPPLKRLYELSKQHGFLVIVDETVGNPINVSCISHADIIVSSLTKIFSGDSNVMAGALILNPHSDNYQKLKQYFTLNYQNTVWREDLLFLERNSRTFKERIQIINKTAEMLCDRLKAHPKVKRIYYPKYDPEWYNEFATGHGFGGLFSMMLENEDEAQKFYDKIQIFKGPSLGTNFTLCCPYTILAHYNELDWAASFGVERHLIRVSVGLEDPQVLLQRFLDCL
ncbi:pyridoxal phosphate-dependent transferase [Gorgonomyces haynaldii]|nr:pyridoxal phosphate-dependent transferase [Gorgonomyces haynaldii]